jgi:hypothetical protein
MDDPLYSHKEVSCNRVLYLHQGISIKPVVNALKVKKAESARLPSMNEKIHERVSRGWAGSVVISHGIGQEEG